MTGEILTADIHKYECAIERAKKFGLLSYIPHLENIIRVLKAIEELDAGVE